MTRFAPNDDFIMWESNGVMGRDRTKDERKLVHNHWLILQGRRTVRRNGNRLA